MQEIWKDVVGYVGYYEVSNKGNVRSVSRKVNNFKGESAKRKGVNMAFVTTKAGYKRVSLRMLGTKRTFRVHRLVAEAFLPNPHQLAEVNHLNGIKDDNRLENLEWVDRRRNIDHAKEHNLFNSPKGSNHHKATITEDTVRAMRKLYAEGNHTQKQISEEFSVHLSKAKHILAGRTWKHVV